MDYDDAVLLIEEQIENPERINLSELANAFPIVASRSEGYCGKVWDYGVKVLELVHQKGESKGEAFDKIGWKTYQSAISTSISKKEFIQCLSFAKYNFFYPERDFKSILNDDRIRVFVKDGIKAHKHSFINPSDLGILTQGEQDAFAGFLSIFDSLQVDDELTLQWSASALRFFLPTNQSYIIAAEALLKVLIRNQRIYSAYYIFRALSENHDGIWNSGISLELFKALIQNHINDNNHGIDILIEICSDPSIQSKCKSNISLQLLIGILSIHLWVDHEIADVEAMAWAFPESIQSDYPNLSAALANFILSKDVPPLPPKFKKKLEKLEADFADLISHAHTEIRDRHYRGVPLAIKVHQDNLKQYFRPILAEIENRKKAEKILEKINRLEPRLLIEENTHQKGDAHPIEGKLFSQMANDYRDILAALRKTTQKMLEIQAIHYEKSAVSEEQFNLYKEFELFSDNLSEVGRLVIQNLIPDLWKSLTEGLYIYKDEEGNYGTR